MVIGCSSRVREEPSLRRLRRETPMSDLLPPVPYLVLGCGRAGVSAAEALAGPCADIENPGLGRSRRVRNEAPLRATSRAAGWRSSSARGVGSWSGDPPPER